METSVSWFCFVFLFGPVSAALEHKAFIIKTSSQVARWEQCNCYMMRLINFKCTWRLEAFRGTLNLYM